MDRTIEKILKKEHIRVLAIDYEAKKRRGEDVSGVYQAICDLCKEVYGFSEISSNPEHFSYTNIYR